MKITDLAKRRTYSVGKGWYKIVHKLCKDIAKIDPKVEVSCIKEKFGGLRFYIMGGNDKVYDLIEKASEKSYTLCEKCGQKGRIRKDLGWVLTLCDKHYKMRKKGKI